MKRVLVIAGATIAVVVTPASGAGGLSLSADDRAVGAKPAVSEARPQPPLRLRQKCVTREERRGVVRFDAADGTRLIGVLLGSGGSAVVLAHQGGGGAPGNLCAWMPYARALRSMGYRVLVFDHRTFGSSASPRLVLRQGRVDRDVVGAVRFLRAKGITDVLLGGASLGGAAVVRAATLLKPQVRGVFTLGATHTFGGVDALAAARSLTVPVLFVASEDDGGGQFAEEAREMFEAAPSADKRLVIFPGNAHGAPQLQERPVRQLVDTWIRDHFAS